MERKLYNEDSQVKVEKMDHMSEEEMMPNQVYGDEEEEEDDDDEEEDEDDEEGGGRCLCDSCGQPFSGLVSLRQHFDRGCPGQKMEEGGANTFKCARCEMEFTMFDQMKVGGNVIHRQGLLLHNHVIIAIIVNDCDYLQKCMFYLLIIVIWF